MATVRGMTPEAIRSLLKKEIGDYQALSIAVSNAKGTSESAIREVESIREDLKNMDFDFDTSQFDKAMEKLEQDMSELTESLDKVAEESLARETKLTALELALNKDREKFNQEMLDMAKELEESKEALKQELTEATEKLSQNLTEVGTNLSNELEKANKTLSEDLAKDLKKLNTDLSKSFGKDLKNLETRQNSKTDALDKNLKDYKSNTDSKMGTLLSEIDKAKAYAEGFLQPGNLVWNPMALDNARGIKTTNSSVEIESIQNTGKGSGEGLKVTNVKTGGCYVHYGDANRHGFELKNGHTFKFFAWVKSSVELKSGAISLKAQYTPGANCGAIPANTWVKVEGEATYTQNVDRYVVFEVYVTSSVPVGATIIIAEPYTIQKVTSDLIVDGAVTSQSLSTGAVTAGKIAADAVTANNIAAGSVGADKIVANAIGADQLAANAVTADKIAANAVDADKIKAKSIGSDQLAANAVTTEKLAAKAVKAENIDASAVTAEKIASKAINGDHIQANSIDATKMTITPGNLFPDPHFKDPCWGTAGSSYAHTNNGGEFRLFPQNAQLGKYYQPYGMSDKGLMLEGNSAYRVVANVWASSNIQVGAKVDMYIRYVNTSGKKSIKLIGSFPAPTGGVSVESVMLSTPEDMRESECTIGFFVNKPWTGGQISMWNVHLTRAADASLIVKGGIQSDHIAANAITSDHMSVGSIDGDRIAANSLDADKIKANSLTSDHVKFKDGFIKNAMIDDGQITNAKIKDLNASKINAGTLNAKRIGSQTITGDKIAANTITSKELAANSITGDKIAANTITGNNIQSESISVGQLKADAIIQSGMSLVATEATGPNGRLEPVWWKSLMKFSDPEYDGEPWYGTFESTTIFPKTVMMKVIPGITYRIEFNIQANKPGSVIFIEMRDQNGNHAVESGAPNNMKKGKPRIEGDDTGYMKTVLDYRYSNTTGTNYLVDDLTVPASPTKVVGRIKFKRNVTHVYLARFYFNHDRGSTQNASVRINNFRVEAEIPKQEDLDARLSDHERYTQQLAQNVARQIELDSKYGVNTVFLKPGYTAYRSAIGFAVRSPSNNGNRLMHFYMDPRWSGYISATVAYTSGDTKTYISSSDDFIRRRPGNVDEAPPFTDYPWYDDFVYNVVNVSEGTISYIRYDIQRNVSYYDVLGVLSFGRIPTGTTIENGPTSKASRDFVDLPPWDKDWVTLRKLL